MLRLVAPRAGPGGPQISQMEEPRNGVTKDLRDPQTYLIIGAAMEVHRSLGYGFLEPVYQAALEVELTTRGIPFTREVDLPVHYKDWPLGVKYRADFVCFGEVLVELKAIERLTSREQSQLINYLSASRIPRGMLLNFGGKTLQYQRFVGPTDPTAVHSVKSVGPRS